MNYKLVDFRSLVSDWYNEYLPEHVDGKAVVVPGADVVYVNALKVDSHRKRTEKFIQSKLNGLASSDGTTIVAMEPRPVDNVRLQPLLRKLESTITDKARLEQILHLANRRYVLESTTFAISQNKEIENLLVGTFNALSKKDIPGVKPYALQSLGVPDMERAMRAFFPKDALTIQGVSDAPYIQVRSTNQLLGELNSKIANGKLGESVQSYIDRCVKSLENDIPNLI